MIRLIIWILIGIVALSFFGISLQNIIESPLNRQNFSYFFELVADGFDSIWLLLQSAVLLFKDALTQLIP